MFYIGQKVICVNDRYTPEYMFVPVKPVKGGEYVIRAIGVDGPNGVGLRFHWLVNPVFKFRDGETEPWFSSLDSDGELVFRPVVEYKTDISIFKKMLVSNQAEKV